MAQTPVTNFAQVTVSGLYDAAATSITLAAGHGSRLPSTFPYPLAWWDATTYANPAKDPNRELVTVTNRVGDVLTVTRGAESTGASTKNTAGKTYEMVESITKAMWDALATQNLSQSFRGLTLSTHPDSDVDDKKTIFSADVIVMNDGEAVSGWSNVVTDITASGVGGLDTGAEQSSVWYEQYAIYNGTTKAGCLHRAKDWFLDLDITAGEDATQGIRSAVDNSTVRVSQGITPVTAGKLMFVDVKLGKIGSPTGNIWFTIEANSGGVPSNTPLATSWKFDVSRIPATATVVRIPFHVPYSVSASTLYHIVAYGDWTVSATNYVGWRMDGTAAVYAGGSKALYNSNTTTWTADTAADMYVKVYIERNNVDFATTVPSGYRYAKIGYVYNDSAGNFKPFEQQGHACITASNASWKYGALASGYQLCDLASLIPPTPVLVSISGCDTGGTYSHTIGSITVTDTAVATERIGQKNLTVNYLSASVYPSNSAPMVSALYQAIVAGGASATAIIWVDRFEW